MHMTATQKKLPPAIVEAREILRRKGWSYRKVAPLLGVCYQHLCLVLTGHRPYNTIVRKIHQLPPRGENHEKSV